VLVPFADPRALAREIAALAARRAAAAPLMCRRAYGLGREMTWDRSRPPYMESFQADTSRPPGPAVQQPLAVRTLAQQQAERPACGSTTWRG